MIKAFVFKGDFKAQTEDVIKLFIILLTSLVTVWTSSLQRHLVLLLVMVAAQLELLTSYISAIIKIEHAVPEILFSRKIYLTSQADWDGILNDLYELDKAGIYRQVGFVASVNDVFERIIVRCIPA